MEEIKFRVEEQHILELYQLLDYKDLQIKRQSELITELKEGLARQRKEIESIMGDLKRLREKLLKANIDEF